jgi:hypothetical protein
MFAEMGRAVKRVEKRFLEETIPAEVADPWGSSGWRSRTRDTQLSGL